MADPVSIAGLVLAIPPVVRVLMSFSDDFKAAKTDITSHIGDLPTLKGILEYIQSMQAMQSDTDVYRFESSEFERLLEVTWSTIHALQQQLQPKKSSLGRSLQRVAWTFKKREVAEQLSRLERLKGAFLMILMGDNINYNQTILSEMSQLRLEVSDDRLVRQAEAADNKKMKLFQWLAPIGPEPAHSTSYSHQATGTGLWFQQGPLEAWDSLHDDDKAAVLWLQGKSGSGKTTLMASAIEHIKARIHNRPSTGLVYFYCSFGTLASQQPVNILASTLVQLCITVPSLYDDLLAKYGKLAEEQTPQSFDVKELEVLLAAHAPRLSRLYFFLDAINESSENYILERMICTLAAKHKNIRIFVTSTDHLDRSRFGDANIIETTMHADVIDKDIATFLESEMMEKPDFTRLSAGLKTDVCAAILENSRGVFRYARSQLYRVQSQYTSRDIKRALVGMPSDLNEVYRRILCRHNSDTAYRAYMRKALLWMSFTNRPLHLEELCEAIVIEEGDVDLDEYSRLHDPLMLLRLGQGLFELDKTSGRVTLSHSSVKTFLTSAHIRTTDAADFALDEVESNNTIVRACLTYLRFNIFASGSRIRSDPAVVSTQSGHPSATPKRLFTEAHKVLDMSHVDSPFSGYPLVAYTAENWPLHVHDGGKHVKQDIQNFMLTRNKPNGGNYAFWIRYIVDDLPIEIILRTSPVYYAASFGHTELLSALITSTHPLNLEQRGGRFGSTALQVACFRRQHSTARLLVEAGANPFALDGSGIDGGFSAFFWAKQNGWEDITELMIDRGTANGFRLRETTHSRRNVDVARETQSYALADTKKPGQSTEIG